MHTVEDRELEGAETTKLMARLSEKKQHVWQRWKREYVHGLIESHHIKRGARNYPKVGEVLLIVGEEKNRGEWKKILVLGHIRGQHDVVRGVVLRHKGHTIERHQTLVCMLTGE